MKSRQSTIASRRWTSRLPDGRWRDARHHSASTTPDMPSPITDDYERSRRARLSPETRRGRRHTAHDQARWPAARAPALALGALGVVFGDIGTSPLYAFREAFEHQDLAVDETNALGVASIAFWALIIIISIKYLMLVMRADNHGEGGILALTALVMPRGRAARGSGGRRHARRVRHRPALRRRARSRRPSRCSAPWRGSRSRRRRSRTGSSRWRASSWSGCSSSSGGDGASARCSARSWSCGSRPSASSGCTRSSGNPAVLGADQPDPHRRSVRGHREGVPRPRQHLPRRHRRRGAVRRHGPLRPPPIRRWYGSCCRPAAQLLRPGRAAHRRPRGDREPVLPVAPEWGVTPLAILATMASVIASQALISGAFSLTVQAVQLDYLPRLTIRHTSASTRARCTSRSSTGR